MTKKYGSIAAALLLMLCAHSGASSAQAHGKENRVARQERSGHKSEAKISMKEARATALAQVPGGRIKSSELEKENNRLIYSFDIRARDGIKEVHIDAINGKVLEVKTESPSGEAAEHRADKRAEKREAKQHRQ
ncbi:MAG: PepSY domain-containing protein [Pyrinomonadaceae bacterium]